MCGDSEQDHWGKLGRDKCVWIRIILYKMDFKEE